MNQKIKTNVGVVIIIIIAITVGAFVWMAQKNIPEPQPVVLPVALPTKSVDETADWKTYTNAEFGYEMKYPAAFSEPAGPHLSNNPAASVSEQNPGLAFQVQFLDAFSPKNLEEAFQTSIRGNSYQEKFKKDIVFNGMPAIEYAGINNSRNVHAMVGELNGKFFDLVVESKNNSKEADALFVKLFANFKAIRSEAAKWEANEFLIKKGIVDNQFFIDNIKMTLPLKWVVSKIQNNSVYIKDLDYKTKYDVFLVLQGIKKYVLAGSGYEDEKERFGNILIKNGAAFQIRQGGMFDVTAVIANENVYEFPWVVEGSEPLPANLDGPWQPDSSFTQEKVWEIMKNISID